MLVVHLGGHARIAACLHQAERLGAHGIVNARHEDVAMLGAREHLARGLDGQRAALVAQREAEARRGASAHFLAQLVVATAAADGVLAAHALIDLHLEHGARVVVEAADQRGVFDIGDARAVQVGFHGLIVLAAVVAQAVRDLRGALHDLGAAGVLAVEGAQRVDLGAAHALLAHMIGMGVHVLAHGLAVLRAALLAAHGVHQQARGVQGDADGGVEAHEHDDALGVDAGVLRAQALDAHLVEHALTALLRALRAEHRAGVHELGRSRALRHQVMLHHGAHHARGALGAQAQTAFRLDGAAVDDALEVLAGDGGEHLLGHHVGCLADAAHEQVGLLEQRRFDGLIAVTGEDAERGVAEMRPELRLIGQKIARSLRGVDCHDGSLLPIAYVPMVRTIENG